MLPNIQKRINFVLLGYLKRVHPRSLIADGLRLVKASVSFGTESAGATVLAKVHTSTDCCALIIFGSFTPSQFHVSNQDVTLAMY